jgi:hypothetical protein
MSLDPMQREIHGAEQRVCFSVYPTLPSTDQTRVASVDKWLAEHHEQVSM